MSPEDSAPNYLQHLRGELLGVRQDLSSGPPGAAVNLELTNDLPVYLNIYSQVNGRSVRKGACKPATPKSDKPDEWAPGSGVVKDVTLPAVLVVTVAGTGGLVCVLEVKEREVINLTFDHLVRPNALGSPPKPDPDRSDAILVPQDTGRAVVGVGHVKQGFSIVREQYWQRLGDSFTLAPGEELTLSTTRTVGVTSSSSTSKTVAETLGMNASAGWGPISVGINASLSSTSTSTQQVTIADELTTYESRTLKSTYDHPVVYFRWQVVDVLSILSGGNTLLHMVSTTQNPAITTGPFSSTSPEPD